MGVTSHLDGLRTGRPVGTRNRRTQEVLDAIEEAGHRDGLLIAAEMANNASLTPETRAPYVKLITEYKHSKLGAIPSPRFISTSVTLPHQDPRTIDQIRENLSHITRLKASGDLDIDSADSLIADQYKIGGLLVDDRKLMIQGGETGEQVIRIEGGLPVMPGLEQLIMPQINGKAVIEGHALEAPKPADLPPLPEEPQT
jgi:hypothetical protein